MDVGAGNTYVDNLAACPSKAMYMFKVKVFVNQFLCKHFTSMGYYMIY